MLRAMEGLSVVHFFPGEEGSRNLSDSKSKHKVCMTLMAGSIALETTLKFLHNKHCSIVDFNHVLSRKEARLAVLQPKDTDKSCCLTNLVFLKIQTSLAVLLTSFSRQVLLPY